jgi:hypothetical protein
MAQLNPDTTTANASPNARADRHTNSHPLDAFVRAGACFGHAVELALIGSKVRRAAFLGLGLSTR